MKKIVLTILLFVSTLALANGGSIYTRYGIGDLSFNYSARSMGLGGLGIALPNSNYISSSNPANWYKINLTRVQTSITFSGKAIKDDNSSTGYSRTAFEGFTVAVPLHQSLGVVASFGILPYSRVDYRLNSTVAQPGVGSWTQRYSGFGGLSKVYIGSSVKLPFDFIFGASFDYYFGKISYESAFDFDEASSFEDASYSSTRNYYGIGSTFGIITPNLANVFNSEEINNFVAAFTLSLKSNIKTDTSIISQNILGTTTVSQGLTSTTIPLKIGFGLGARIFDKYNIGLDYLNQNWSDFSFSEQPDPRLSNYNKLSIGLEFDPSISNYSDFWEKVKYRAGFSYETTQYNFNNEEIKQYLLSLGLSFPVGITNSIDLALYGGIKGTTKNNLVQENIFGANFTLNFGELWFIRKLR